MSVFYYRNAILLYENQIGELSSILRSVSPERRRRLKSQVQFTFKKYFQTIDRITNTVLEAISNRIFVHNSHTVEQWNMNPQSVSYPIKSLPLQCLGKLV